MDESQPIPLSVEQCKDLLKMIGQALCVKAELISTRLLSKEDKQDMLNGLVPVETLMTAVKCWMAAGMPDYANGHTDPYKAPEPKREPLYTPEPVKAKYRPFKR
jgi:hypothetical protein